jgi:hypothetical protein
MISMKLRLAEEAMKVLDANWRGKYTIPAPGIYPNQWSWDSAFIAIGYSNYDQGRAMKELMSIFEGQWKNGMLPHVIYRKSSGYFPGPRFWQTGGSRHAPGIRTSGITQPPVHAIAALYIYRNARDRSAAERFLAGIYPKLLAFHRYLMTRRDPERSGLVTIFHPWESGLDNSVRWDGPLSRIDARGIPRFRRKDTGTVIKSQRPTDEDYRRYVYLADLMRKCGYDERKIYRKSPFRIKEVVFSTILYVANKSMLEIARILGRPAGEIRTWIRRTERNYFRYFCTDVDRKPIVFDFDLCENKRIMKRTSASLISLYSGLLTREQAKTVLEWMKAGTFYRKSEGPMVSSMSISEKDFSPVNYWRGPIWININWLIYKGIKHHGFHGDAESMWDASLHLIRKSGFHEYYNPLNGKGLGARDFSWTASLLLDILFEDRRVRDILISGNVGRDSALSYLKEAGLPMGIIRKIRDRINGGS